MKQMFPNYDRHEIWTHKQVTISVKQFRQEMFTVEQLNC